MDAGNRVPGNMVEMNKTAPNSNRREFHVERKCEMYSLLRTGWEGWSGLVMMTNITVKHDRKRYSLLRRELERHGEGQSRIQELRLRAKPLPVC